MGEVRAERRLDHAVHVHATDLQRLLGALTAKVVGVDNPLARHERLLGRHAEHVVVVPVGSEVLRVATRVGSVRVHDRDVERQRGHGDELFAVVGRRHRAELRVDLHHRRPEPGATGQERHPHGRGVQAPLQHSLVELHGFDRSALARRPEVRLQRNRVERHEPVHDLAGLFRRAEHPDVRTSVTHDREVLEIRAHDRAHDRHRLAPRAPTADADRETVRQLRDDIGLGHALVGQDPLLRRVMDGSLSRG